MKTAILGIDYDAGYKRVYLSTAKARVVFATGDPVEDFANAVQWASELSDEYVIMTTSSLEGFCFDVGGYHFDEDDMLVKDR